MTTRPNVKTLVEDPQIDEDLFPRDSLKRLSEKKLGILRLLQETVQGTDPFDFLRSALIDLEMCLSVNVLSFKVPDPAQHGLLDMMVEIKLTDTSTGFFEEVRISASGRNHRETISSAVKTWILTTFLVTETGEGFMPHHPSWDTGLVEGTGEETGEDVNEETGEVDGSYELVDQGQLTAIEKLRTKGGYTETDVQRWVQAKGHSGVLESIPHDLAGDLIKALQNPKNKGGGSSDG